jgi:hypothetical protein
MRGNAADWIASATSTTWAEIEKSFGERFTQHDLRRWQHTGAVWARKQKTDESVDDFVTQIRKLGKIAKIDGDNTGKNMIYDAVVQGTDIPATRTRTIPTTLWTDHIAPTRCS